MISSFSLSFRKIRSQFHVKRNIWVLLVMIILLGMYLRAITPVYLVTFYDEFAHINTGKNIVSEGIAATCTTAYSTVEMNNCTPFNEPAGFPYVVGLFLLFLGVSLPSAYAVNLVMGSLLGAAVFLFCFLLFKNEKIGLYGAFLIAILPLYVLLSRNIEPDGVFAFFTLMTLSCFVLFFRIRDLKTGVLAVSILAFSVSIKQEGILLLPLVVVLSLLFVDSDSFKRGIKNLKFVYIIALLAILITPHLIQLSYEVIPPLLYGESTSTGVGGKLLDFGNIGYNFGILGRAACGLFYPVLFNIFALAGLCLLCSIKKQRAKLAFLMVFLSIFMFVYLGYSGRIVEKYLITGLIPLFCLAGAGLFAFEKSVLRLLGGRAKKRIVAIAVPAALGLILFSSSVPYILEVLGNVQPLHVSHGYPRDLIQYKEIDAAMSVGGEVCDSCYIIAENPLIFSPTNLKGISTDLALSRPEMIKKILKDGRSVYYFEDMFCTDFFSLGDRCGIVNETVERCENVRLNITSKCGDMKRDFTLAPVEEFKFDKYSFELYSLTGVA
jgi:4-amino-4-deoxy-L-arabinose transferase-like glycosyltransferase